MRADQFGEPTLKDRGTRTEEAHGVAKAPNNRLAYTGIIVPEEMWRESRVVIDILVVIHIPDLRALSPDKSNLGPGRAVDGDHSAGNKFTVAFENCGRFGVAFHCIVWSSANMSSRHEGVTPSLSQPYGSAGLSIVKPSIRPLQVRSTVSASASFRE